MAGGFSAFLNAKIIQKTIQLDAFCVKNKKICDKVRKKNKKGLFFALF